MTTINNTQTITRIRRQGEQYQRECKNPRTRTTRIATNSTRIRIQENKNNKNTKRRTKRRQEQER